MMVTMVVVLRSAAEVVDNELTSFSTNNPAVAGSSP